MIEKGDTFYVLKCTIGQDYAEGPYVRVIRDYGGHGELATLEDAKKFGTVRQALNFMTGFEPKTCLTLVRVTEEKVVDTLLVTEEVR